MDSWGVGVLSRARAGQCLQQRPRAHRGDQRSRHLL